MVDDLQSFKEIIVGPAWYIVEFMNAASVATGIIML